MSSSDVIDGFINYLFFCYSFIFLLFFELFVSFNADCECDCGSIEVIDQLNNEWCN